jgi:type IV pilus assembly protein PilC
MMYPTVVTVVAIGITIFLLVKVIPVFGDIYKGFGADLPGPTLFLMNVSNILKHYFLLFLLGGGGLVYGWFHFIKTKPGREFWDARRIKLPIWCHAHKIAWRVSRERSPRSSAAACPFEVLQIVSQTVGTSSWRKRSGAAQTLSAARDFGGFEQASRLPSMIIRMITAGEQTGKIDNMLERISISLDERLKPRSRALPPD